MICKGSFYSGSQYAPPDVLMAALGCVIVYAGVVPLMYAALLYSTRESLTRRKPHTALSRSLGFLAGSYKTRLFWWELVEVARKLIITGFLALVYPGSFLQAL